MPGDEIDIASEAGTTVGKVEGQGNVVGTGNTSVSGEVVVMGSITVQGGTVSTTELEILIKRSILLKTEAEESTDADKRKALLQHAMELLAQVREKDPTNTEAMLQQAILLIELTPDDPTDEVRLLERVRNLLFSPKDEAEQYCLARATYLLATHSKPVNRTCLEDAKSIFQRLGRSEWVRQCEASLAEILAPPATDPKGGPSLPKVEFDLDFNREPMTPPPPAVDEAFQPIGNWAVQVTDGSSMSASFDASIQCQITQVNPMFGINVTGLGQWVWVQALSNLQIQGMIPGGLPFAMSLFITGKSGDAFIGFGTDGHGYQFTRV